jgi:TRAP-type mannitol/chloroaromatic compound transport system permease small subunit
MKRLADRINTVVQRIGDGFAWTLLILIVMIVVQVTLRYGFGKSMVFLEELHWVLYAMGMLVGIAYAIPSDSHIRADLLHQRLSRRQKAVIEIVGVLLFLIPFFGALGWHGWAFTTAAFRLGENSSSTAGLHQLWLIKMFIPIACLLVLTAAVAKLINCISDLKPTHA